MLYPKGARISEFFLKSVDGSLKNAEVVSQIEAGYEPDDIDDEEDGEVLSVTIGEVIINPNAAHEIAAFYENMKKAKGNSKS